MIAKPTMVEKGKLHELYFGRDHVAVIQPQTGWRALDVRELWAYRELLFMLTMRDIKVRYKQTVLGFGWAIIQPVMLMIVFGVFFGRLAKMPSDGYPYPIFVYAALLPWTFFAQAVTASSNSLINSAQLVSKVYFPRLVIPMAALGGNLLDFVISAGVLLLIMVYYKVSWSLNLLLTPLLLIGLIVTALGVGTLLSALTVAYRDFRHVVPFMMQFWLFATPVVYPTSLVPAAWRWAFYLNPMVGIIDGFRCAFLGKTFDPVALLISFFVAGALFLIGVAYFEKVERRFADII
jgi:lipopolysaccharide transport system permease protein